MGKWAKEQINSGRNPKILQNMGRAAMAQILGELVVQSMVYKSMVPMEELQRECYMCG